MAAPDLDLILPLQFFAVFGTDFFWGGTDWDLLFPHVVGLPAGMLLPHWFQSQIGPCLGGMAMATYSILTAMILFEPMRELKVVACIMLY